MFKDTKEAIICVNEKLDIVYNSPIVTGMFEIKRSETRNLNCIFTTRWLNNVKKAIESNKFKVIKFESHFDKTLKKCIITPILAHNNKFAILLFQDTDKEMLDNISKKQIEFIIEDTEDKIILYTNRIISAARAIKSIDENIDIKKNLIKSAYSIRKSYKNSMYISEKYIPTDKVVVTNINTYIKRIVDQTSQSFSENELEIDCHLSSIYPYSKISIEVLDIVLFNLIAELKRKSLGKANIKIFTQSLAKDNLIILTNDWADDNRIEKLFNHLNDQNVIENTAIYTVQKLITQSGGKLSLQRENNGGISIIITLPKDEAALNELNSPAYAPKNTGVFSTMNILLSDVMEDKINLID